MNIFKTIEQTSYVVTLIILWFYVLVPCFIISSDLKYTKKRRGAMIQLDIKINSYFFVTQHLYILKEFYYIWVRFNFDILKTFYSIDYSRLFKIASNNVIKQVQFMKSHISFNCTKSKFETMLVDGVFISRTG